MAVTPKPADKPYWATNIVVDGGGRTNIIAPPVGREPEGWTHLEKPPRNYVNHLWHWNGEWIDYQEAMTDAAQKAATFVIAAEDSSDAWKQAADYVIGAGADASILINTALAALPAAGGRVLLSDGTFTLDNPISISAQKAHLQGQSTRATTITLRADSTVNAVEIADAQTAILSDFGIYGTDGTGAAIQNGVVVTTTGTPTEVYCHRIHVDRVVGGPTVALGTPKGVAFYAAGTNVRMHLTECRRDMYGDAVTPVYSGEDVIGYNGAHVEIDGFAKKNLNAYAASTADSMWFEGCTYSIDRVVIEDNSCARGVYASACPDGYVGRVLIDGCTGDGFRTSTSAARLIVDNLVVNNAGNNGAYINQASEGRLKIATDNAGAVGVLIGLSSDMKMNLTAIGSAGIGISCVGCTDCILDVPQAVASGGAGISIDGTSYGVTACTPLTTSGASNSILIYGDKCEINGGRSYQDDAGLEIQGDDCDATRYVVDDPQGIGVYGIACIGAARAHLSSCRVSNMAGAGANKAYFFDSACTHCVADDVYIDTITGMGIDIDGPDTVINGGLIREVSTHGINVTSTARAFAIRDIKFDGAGPVSAYIYIDPGAIVNFEGLVHGCEGKWNAVNKPQEGINLRTNGGGLITQVAIHGNYLASCATLADLNVQGAFANAKTHLNAWAGGGGVPASPWVPGGGPLEVTNVNYILTAGIA